MFRRGLDVKKVYLTLAALGYFYLSNRFTLSSFLGTDLMQPSECDAWLAEIRRVMTAAVGVAGAALDTREEGQWRRTTLRKS